MVVLKELGFNGVDWVHVPQHRIQWLAYVRNLKEFLN